MSIKLVKPTYEQLEYTKHLWLDEKTMSDVGGTHELSDGQWWAWYQKMVMSTDSVNQYFQIYNGDIPVGEISFHRYDVNTKSADLNFKIEHRHRRNGYAKQAFKLFKEYFFNEFGGKVLKDNVLSLSGIEFLPKLGFELKRVEGSVHYFELKRDSFI